MRVASCVFKIVVMSFLLLLPLAPGFAQDSIKVDGMAIKLMDIYGSDLINKRAGLIAGISIESEDENSVGVSVGIRNLGGQSALDIYGFLMDNSGQPVPEVYSSRVRISSFGNFSFSVSYEGSENPRSEELVVFLMAAGSSQLIDSRSIQLQRNWGSGSSFNGSSEQQTDSGNSQSDQPPVSDEPVEDVVIEPVAIAGTPTPEDEKRAENPNKPRPRLENLVLTLPASMKLQTTPTKTQPNNTTRTNPSNTKPNNTTTRTQPTQTAPGNTRFNTKIYTQAILPGLFLYSIAPNAIWRNGPQTLPINGATNDNRGFARQESKATLSDGKQYSSVLYTHPRWVNRGIIMGTYSNITIPKTANAFRTGIGMLRGAQSNNTFTFQVIYRPASGSIVTLLKHTIKYSDGVKDIVYNLPASLKGSKGNLILMVSANGSPGRGWCAWVNPRFQ